MRLALDNNTKRQEHFLSFRRISKQIIEYFKNKKEAKIQ